MLYLKKHYEKVVLVVVLLVVAGLAFWLTNQVDAVRTTLADQLQQQIRGTQNALKETDLVAASTSLEKLNVKSELRLDGDHRAFNPVAWLKNATGFVRAPEKGHGLTLTKISPLNLAITYKGVVGIGDPFRYQFVVEKAFEKKPSKRRPLTTSLTEGTKNDTFILREAKGSKDSSNEVVIELSGENITLVKDKPFTRPMGYSADFKSDTSNREYLGKRQDDSVVQGGAQYKIISIGESEVIIEAPNKSRSILRLDSSK